MSNAPKANDYGIVILAAGSSSRLGTPKQLLVLEGLTLIKKAALIALEITSQVIVVTGAHAEKIEAELQSLPLTVSKNEAFKNGIAASIRVGLNTLVEKYNDIEGVVFMVCDQPYLTADIINQLVNAANTSEKGIVACSYGNSLGIPALFKKKHFQELLELRGDVGAKKLIINHSNDVVAIPFPKGDIDIDTMEEWHKVRAKG